MVIYNVTVKVDHEVHDDWIQWMSEKHIPDVIHTGCFSKHKLCKLLDQDETDGITYSIQYFANTMSDYQKYKELFAPALQEDHTNRYKDKFVAFRTLLEVVNQS